LESKGKLAIVNPQRRMGCAALVPEHSFTRDHGLKRNDENWVSRM
jgi:hypothetical protein